MKSKVRIKFSLPVLFILSHILYSNVSFSNETTRVYKYKSTNGTIAFSDIEPLGIEYQEIKIDCYACKLNSLVDWHKAKLYLTEFSSYIEHAAYINKIDPAFIRAIIHAESHFDKHAISKQGAQGLMQLMPKTAHSLGVKNAFIAKQNINGGAKHLAHLLKKYHGNIQLASAAYNAGEGAVKKFSGIPPFAETQVYVERVEILHRRYQRANRI
jgi:soluble lytic murein transglycosylase-like protein